MRDRSDILYINRRIRILKWYIAKLVNSGRLENRDWTHINFVLVEP